MNENPLANSRSLHVVVRNISNISNTLISKHFKYQSVTCNNVFRLQSPAVKKHSSLMFNIKMSLTLYPIKYSSFQPVIHDSFNKGHGMFYPVCGMMHIKEPLLLIGKSSLCGASGFPLSLSKWSFIICLTPYNRKIKRVECVVK